MAEVAAPFIIRNHRIEDESFIYSTWLLGLYYGDDKIKAETPDHAFMKAYRPIIRLLLARPDTKIKVVCVTEDPDTIIGYSVFEGDTLHWVFVRPAWRKFGLAKKLIPPSTAAYSHLTKLGNCLRPRHWLHKPI
jgi:GNAT superfamily N-acetyltransferase